LRKKLNNLIIRNSLNSKGGIVVICVKCREEISTGEEMNYRGQILCEDCYVDTVSIPRTCDVAAVHSAKLTRKLAGQ